jgi:hypothetical protein
MRFVQHVAVISALAAIAAVVIFSRPPNNKVAAAIPPLPSAQVAVVQK